LYALQHRGQESCGIAVNNDREITYYKDMGLLNEVFDSEIIERLKGNMAVGHVRYSARKTANDPENTQPLVLKYIKGTLAIVHNGNIINGDELRREYMNKGAIFQTSSDTETMAYAIACERIGSKSIEGAIQKMMNTLKGAYSTIIMSPTKLIAFRDRWGFRPLCMGFDGDCVVFASESCALEAVGAKFEREVEPGEIIVVDNGKIRSIKDNIHKDPNSICIFEYIYFARHDSVIHGQGVYNARKAAGKLLAKQHPVEADVVTGVPDSGIGAAMGFAEQSGIHYTEGFVKNRYVGRTFIKTEQKSREIAVKIKLNALKSNVCGKRVVMVDDSIVRGTTCARIVNLLRDAGATEVHVRISAPPFLWQCFFGTDIPTRTELIACNNSIDEVKKLIGADSLAFLDVKDLKEIVKDIDCGFCDACFTGIYPVSPLDDKTENI
jgi:amidophosphoribosyltransferase